MSMRLSECNFSVLSTLVRKNCLEDCKTTFPQKYFQELHQAVSANGNSDNILNFAHKTCNEWRKSKEIVDIASRPSNIFLLTTISLVAVVVAAKLLSSQMQEAKTSSTNRMSSFKATTRQKTHKSH